MTSVKRNHGCLANIYMIKTDDDQPDKMNNFFYRDDETWYYNNNNNKTIDNANIQNVLH